MKKMFSAVNYLTSMHGSHKLLKDYEKDYNVNSLAKEMGITSMGARRDFAELPQKLFVLSPR